MNVELISTGYTYDDGRIAINNAFSGQASFNTFSATSTYVTQLRIQNIQSGTSVTNLGVDLNGNVVSGGSTPSSGTFIPLTDIATVVAWDYSLGPNSYILLTENVTLAIKNVTDASYGTILIKQDAPGNRSLTFSGSPYTNKVVNGGAGSILLTSTGGAEDILSFVCKGSILYWTVGYNYN